MSVGGGAATVAGRRRLRRAIPRRPRLAALRAAVPSLSARMRRRLLLAGLVALVLAMGYQFWLRDSSFVAVESVTITGLTTSDAEQVRLALKSASRSMTTLHVDHDALERAVAGYPVVRELEVTTDFPHDLRVHVIEHHAAALAVSEGGSLPVAADGTILRGLPVEGRLPAVRVDGPLGADRLADREARAAVAVAGTAPSILRSRITDIRRRSEEGLVARLREGPELIFGDTTRLRAKWAAAARVLADLEARGASYIDLRIPSRPAAGGLPAETVAPVAPAGVVPIDPATGAPATTATDPATTTTTTPPAGAESPAATDPATQTPTQPTTPSTGTAPVTPQTEPTAPVTGGTGGGATAGSQP
jgi:cell division protein FtsQ